MNDSKMVSAPRALLERLQERLDPHRDAADWTILCQALLADPAEDVRAVDEPVAWMDEHGEVVSKHLQKFNMESSEGSKRFAASYGIPLYRHAQPQPIPQTPLHPPISTWPTWANWCGLNTDGYWWYYADEPVLLQGGRAPRSSTSQCIRGEQGEPSNAWAVMIYELKQS